MKSSSVKALMLFLTLGLSVSFTRSFSQSLSKTMLPNSRISSIIPDGSGGWIAITSQGVLMRLDANGDELWTILPEFRAAYGDYGSDLSVTPTADGNFVAGGSWYGCGLGSAGHHMIKVSASGDTIWQWPYMGPSGDNPFIQVVKGLSTGHILTAGHNMLIKLDAGGDTALVTAINKGEVHDIFEALDGSYIFATDSGLVETNTSGAITDFLRFSAPVKGITGLTDSSLVVISGARVIKVSKSFLPVDTLDLSGDLTGIAAITKGQAIAVVGASASRTVIKTLSDQLQVLETGSFPLTAPTSIAAGNSGYAVAGAKDHSPGVWPHFGYVNNKAYTAFLAVYDNALTSSASITDAEITSFHIDSIRVGLGWWPYGSWHRVYVYNAHVIVKNNGSAMLSKVTVGTHTRSVGYIYSPEVIPCEILNDAITFEGLSVAPGDSILLHLPNMRRIDPLLAPEIFDICAYLSMPDNLIDAADSNSYKCVQVEDSSNVTAIAQAPARALTIYPNPAAGSINVRAEGAHESEGLVYNSLGQPVISFNLSNGRAALDISSLEPGIYFMEVAHAERVARVRFIKQ